MRFFAPPEALARLVSTLFLIEVDLPEGGTLIDYLLPEWATLRIFDRGFVSAENRCGSSAGATRLAMTGPQAHEVRFEIASGRHWGVNLTPLGWASLLGEPASDWANVLIDCQRSDLCNPLLPVAESLFAEAPDTHGEHARLTASLAGLAQRPVPGETQIEAITRLLVNPDVSTASDLAQRAGMGQRTLERLALRIFGFSPKLLLRRQRFMRSLTDFTLDPSLKWIDAMDAIYHDQAHFVREFRLFMGMTPSEYAELERPIMAPALHARERFIHEAARRARQPSEVLPFPAVA